ncbi:MAG: hypothetical protein JJT76_15580 [Clostridiaceae bacterium]|nr:hypothetical protein [Clostridiaceae bacterium]
MEETLKLILEKITEMDSKMNSKFNELDSKIDKLQTDITEVKTDQKAVKVQTAELTEFKTETKQSLEDIKDNMKFLMFKEAQTEKDIFMLKQSKNR